MVYVLDQDGYPLMPTERHGKVRRMLKHGEAKVMKKKKENLNEYVLKKENGKLVYGRPSKG